MTESVKNRTVLGADCHITGQITLDNDALILGDIQGTVKVTGQLDAGPSARLRGLVQAGTLRLAGHIRAVTIVQESVELLPGAHLSGRLFAPRLTVAQGATLQAQVCVGPSALATAQSVLDHMEQTAQKPALSPAPSAPQAPTESAPPQEPAAVAADTAQTPSPIEAAHQDDAAVPPSPTASLQRVAAMLQSLKPDQAGVAPAAPAPSVTPAGEPPAVPPPATLPTSVYSFLQRRRPPKVLSSRKTKNAAPPDPQPDQPAKTEPDNHLLTGE